MSWQAATLSILAVALVGGFAWYERSRPPSQVIALVAALAAVAIAGRVALAAVPNLVATTDIVLFAGYALGPAAGFAVGAIAGLVSNFWLGQGPWTPWQMAGWGGVGLIGALLAMIARGRIPGRFVLAGVCGLAAVLFGALMNFSTMASFGGEASVERFAALQVRAIPFDLMHVAGNVLLAFIAGPAILRMLGRFRRRFEWTRLETAADTPVAPAGREQGQGVLSGGTAAVTVGAILACISIALVPAESRAAAADKGAAVAWLGSVQNADGGFGPSPGDESSAVTTGWTVMGLAAAGVHPEDMRSRGRNTPIDFLRRNIGQVRSTGDIARTVLALEAAGVEPRRFAGRNLIADLRGRMRQDGSFEGWPGTTAFAIIALRNSGAAGGIRRSLSWLRAAQGRDGGWGPVPGARSDPDTTGAVLQAIGGRDLIKRALGYLRRAQRPSGGFPLGGTSSVNTQSTAWALQGIIAVGLDPDRHFRGRERNATEFLAAMQMPDGHFRYSASSDQTPVWVTASVLVAVAGKTFPVSEPPRRPRPDRRPPASDPFPEHVPAPPLPSGGAGGGGFGGGASPVRPGPSSGGGGGAGLPDPGPGGSFEPQPVDPDAVGAGPRQPDRPGRRGRGSDRPNERLDETRPIPIDLDGEVGPVATTRPGPSPAAPAGIGMGLAGMTIGGMWWLGRRRAW